MKKTKRLHFRRCHLCSGVSESEGEIVDRCLHCGKPMAPFYFFNDAEVTPFSEFEPRPAEEGRLPDERVPVRGFTAYW
jgi:hypothetical protein